MLLENQYPFNKAIMVSLVGAPNVGRSSLVNHLLGFDLTAVSNRPQTTRNAFHCNFTVDHTEIVLVDTPGLHRSSKEINLRMNQQAKDGMEGSDLNLLLMDLTHDLVTQMEDFRQGLKNTTNPTWLVFTKSDLWSKEDSSDEDRAKQEKILAEFFQQMKSEFPTLERFFIVSAKTGDNIHELLGGLCDKAQPGPHLYPNGDVSNKSERFFVTEYIREQAFKLLKDELPYEMAVVIDEYRDVKRRDEERIERERERERERENEDYQSKKRQGPASEEEANQVKPKIVSYISASILVNRPSQRAIVVGSKGAVIKEIGIRARKKIEAMVGGPVHLNLHVKVSPHWYKNNFVLEELGLPRAPQSRRVWRKKV